MTQAQIIAAPIVFALLASVFPASWWSHRAMEKKWERELRDGR